MRAAKTKKTKVKKAHAKKPKAVKPKTKIAKKPSPEKKSAKAKVAAPVLVRAFRYTAAQTVQVRFGGEKKPENFRVDDMSEASLVALNGQAKHYFQFRLVSNDRQNPDGSERCFWFFDPKPVGLPDPIYPALWKPVGEQALEGDAVTSHSGPFSTRSVTGYDGSGACHVVKPGGAPTYWMSFDFNGKREFCESLPVAIEKGDVLAVSSSR